MMTLTENAAYLKGLAEGLDLDESKPEAKITLVGKAGHAQPFGGVHDGQGDESALGKHDVGLKNTQALFRFFHRFLKGKGNF